MPAPARTPLSQKKDGEMMRPNAKNAENPHNGSTFRPLILTSPVWLAFVLILARHIGPNWKAVIEFMTASPLR
jgi:hypothetical protein